MPIVKSSFDEPMVTIGNYSKFGITSESPVIIFTTDWCPVCQRLKNYFNLKNINYIEYDVEKDIKGLQLFNELKGDSYPLILIDNNLIRGFSQIDVEIKLRELNLIV
ncbi:glutaredoxin family protein [Psychrobium sp. nBUS_13]|uniref:glutaredoxin family protein n=1 Tax=Psychrobium sp. nBUS_13 TaxID=3395319 RepID=UPI003EB98273